MNSPELSDSALDAAVARDVFGLEVEERTNTRTRERDFVERTPSGRDWVRVAFYSRSMGASLEVVAELRKRGWTRVDTLWREGSRWNEPGDPRVILQHDDGRRVEATGPANEALCRAAIKAVAP